MDQWIAAHGARIAQHAARDLAALVGVSSPSGDVPGAEEAIAVVVALAPPQAVVHRLPCSSPEHAPDLLLSITGAGTRRLLLVGHVDTVIAHADHRPMVHEGDRLVGSGTVDMKGGDVLALGVLQALAEDRAEEFAEVSLLLVCDEEWRTDTFAHTERFAGFDACLCFEAGEPGPDGGQGVVVRRKAAGSLNVTATGRSAHSGAAPDDGRNALLALAQVAQLVADAHDPHGPQRLTAVPTILRSGEALNVVPGSGELIADLRADSLDAFEPVLAAIPGEIDEVAIDARMVRRWPGMDARASTIDLLAAASAAWGAPIAAGERGGASDASHFAASIPWTVDGLGPRGAGAHAPHEYVDEASLRIRAEVALAVADAALRTAL